jgi:hypothetical protein
MPICKACGNKTGVFSVIIPDKTHLCLSCAKKNRQEKGAVKKPVLAGLLLLNGVTLIATIYAFIVTFPALQGKSVPIEGILIPAGIVVFLLVFKFFIMRSKKG